VCVCVRACLCVCVMCVCVVCVGVRVVAHLYWSNLQIFGRCVCESAATMPHASRMGQFTQRRRRRRRRRNRHRNRHRRRHRRRHRHGDGDGHRNMFTAHDFCDFFFPCPCFFVLCPSNLFMELLISTTKITCASCDFCEGYPFPTSASSTLISFLDPSRSI